MPPRTTPPLTMPPPMRPGTLLTFGWGSSGALGQGDLGYRLEAATTTLTLALALALALNPTATLSLSLQPQLTLALPLTPKPNPKPNPKPPPQQAAPVSALLGHRILAVAAGARHTVVAEAAAESVGLARDLHGLASI